MDNIGTSEIPIVRRNKNQNIKLKGNKKEMSQFIKVGLRVYNTNQIHSITMNKDGLKGWMKVVDNEKKDGYDKIPLTPEDYTAIQNQLLGYSIEVTRKPTRKSDDSLSRYGR